LPVRDRIRAAIHAVRGVSPGTLEAKDSVLFMGTPASVRRTVTDRELDLIRRSAKGYIRLAAEYTAARGV